MTALSVRLPDDLDAMLGQEAEAEGKSRSEIARLAIAEFLTRREKERFMAELVAAAQALASDPASRRESLEIANDLPNDGLDATIESESAAGIDPAEQWWR